MSTRRDDPHAPGLRGAIERRSAVPVVFLHGLPRWVLLLAVFAPLAAGMTINGWPGAAALGALALFLGWFAYLNWPVLDAGGRVLRIIGLVALVGFAIGQGIDRF